LTALVTVAGMLQAARTPLSDRTVWLATGAAWALSSAILLAGPAYWDPATVLDWVAVLAYTAAWLLFGPAIVLASRLVPSRSARFVALLLAVAAAVTGVANVVEDGLGVAAAGTLYVTAILVATMLLVPLAYLFARDRSNALAILALVLFVGIGFTSGGGGGPLVLAAFVVLALRTQWFLPRRPTLPPDAELAAGPS